MKDFSEFLFPFILLIIFQNPLFSQLEKVMHQTFEIEDANEIALDLVGEYEIEFWAGNNVMTETKVELYDASPAILHHFIEKAKRYDFEMEIVAGKLTLQSSDKERKAIRTKEKECSEIVKVRVFVPDNFEKTSDTSLVKKS